MNDVPLPGVLPDWAIAELKAYMARKAAGQFTVHTDDRGKVARVQPNYFITEPKSTDQAVAHLTDKPP